MPHTTPAGADAPVINVFGHISRRPATKETDKGRVLEFGMTVEHGDEAPTFLYDLSCWDEELMQSVPRSGDLVVEGFFAQRECAGRTYNKLAAIRLGRVLWL